MTRESPFSGQPTGLLSERAIACCCSMTCRLRMVYVQSRRVKTIKACAVAAAIEAIQTCYCYARSTARIIRHMSTHKSILQRPE